MWGLEDSEGDSGVIRGAHGGGKKILESRAISNVPKLDGKQNYKDFSRSLVNALNEIRLGFRDLAKFIAELVGKKNPFTKELFEKGRWDKKVNVITEGLTEVGTETTTINMDVGNGWPNLEWDALAVDLYTVLSEKLIGDAADVLTGDQNEGIAIYVELHKLCTDQSRTALRIRCTKLMRPDKAAKESEIWKRIQEWETEYRQVVASDESNKTGEQFKVAAIQDICVGKSRRGRNRDWSGLLRN